MISSFRGKYNFLSNFYECMLHYNGLRFCSLEAAYQASKLENEEDRVYFSTLSAKDSKKEIKKYKIRKDWNKVKFSIMANLLCIKFSNPILKNKLLDTGDEELIEGNNWGDTVWGVCNGEGDNMLGKLLMKTREYYRNVEE